MPSEDLSKETVRFVVTPDGELFGRDSEAGRELARRIYACFIACEGIATEELERGIIADMRRVIAGVQPLLQERLHAADAA
jgi:hypothetical protein